MNKKDIFIICCLAFSAQAFGQKETFSDFLREFSRDSVFQLERISFPLEFVFVEEENFSVDTVFISKDEYRINVFYYELIKCSEAYPVVYSNFEYKEDDSDERVFRWKGFTGMDERYFFRRTEGKWRLIKIEILGT